MNYKDKLSLARKMRTPFEAKHGIGPFMSKAWLARRDSIAARVSRQQAAAHERALGRREVTAGKLSLLTRAKRAIRAANERRQEARRARAAAHARRIAARTV